MNTSESFLVHRHIAAISSGWSLASIFKWLALIIACMVLGIACVLIGGVAIDKPAFVVALPLILAVGFMLIISPKTLFLAIVLFRAGTNPIFEETRFPLLGGLGGLLNLTIILLAALIISREPKRVPKAAYVAWIPFVMMQCIGLLYSPDPIGAFRILLGQCSAIALFLTAFCLVKDKLTFDKLLRVIVLSSVPVTIVTIAFIALGKTAGSLDPSDGDGSRYGGPFPHANILAFYLVLSVSVIIYLWKRENNKPGWLGHIITATYIMALLGLLVFTKTRSAWIEMLLIFIIYGLLWERRYLLYILLGIAGAMLIPEVHDRVMGLAQGNEVIQYAKLNSFAWRKLLWSDALSWMATWRYLTGYGAQGFFYHSPVFFSTAGGINWGAHSVPVQLFFELGIFGVMAYVWTFIACWKMLRSIGSQDKLLKVMIGALLWCYLIVSISDNMLSYLVFNWYFWLTIGAACALACRQHEKSAISPGLKKYS